MRYLLSCMCQVDDISAIQHKDPPSFTPHHWKNYPLRLPLKRKDHPAGERSRHVAMSSGDQYQVVDEGHGVSVYHERVTSSSIQAIQWTLVKNKHVYYCLECRASASITSASTLSTHSAAAIANLYPSHPARSSNLQHIRSASEMSSRERELALCPALETRQDLHSPVFVRNRNTMSRAARMPPNLFCISSGL